MKNLIDTNDIRRIRLSILVTFVFSLMPSWVYAFDYTTYDHYSFANCTLDNENVTPIVFCEITTGSDGRIPTKLSGVVFYSFGYEGIVSICAQNLELSITKCVSGEVFTNSKVVFDPINLRLDQELYSQWWDWVLYIAVPIWNTELRFDEPRDVLKGYKVFYNSP